MPDDDRSDLRDGVVLWFLRRAVEPDGQVLRRVREATHAGHPVGCPVSGVAVGFAGEECAAVPDCGFVGDVDESDSAGDVGEFAYGPTFSGCGVHQEHRVFRDREWAVLASV
jgi:hypothetical protein